MHMMRNKTIQKSPVHQNEAFYQSFFIPILINAWAAVCLHCGSQFNEASAFTAETVLKAWTSAAEVKPLGINLSARFLVVRNGGDQVLNPFIKPVFVNLRKKATLADRSAIQVRHGCQQSSIARTEHF